jgi:hypothetical protein
VTVTRADVLIALSRVIDSSTIIVGHSLSSDFDALGITHTRVIDTAALYPHKQGWPFKRALKELARECLGKEVQVGDQGHSPITDALIAFELAMHFIMAPEDTRASLLPSPWSGPTAAHDDRYSLFHHIQSAALPSAAINNNNNNNNSPREDVITVVHHSCKGYGLDMTEKFCRGDGLESDVRKAYSLFENDQHLSAAEKALFKVRC